MSHDTRFSGGLAYGKYGNLFVRSDNLIGFGDTTPDVTDGNFFIEANTSATTITHFDLTEPSGGSAFQHFQGKVIRILFTTDNTTITNGGRLILTEGVGVVGSGTVLDLVYSNSSWYETSRSKNNQSSVLSITLGGGSSGINVNNVDTILASGVSALNTIQSFSGGYIGQVINLAMANSNSVQIIDAGNIAVVNSNNFVLSSSGSYQILKTTATLWKLGHPVA